MVKKGKSFCGRLNTNIGCCKVESLISVDKRGQMVLPKEVRDKANIRAGDKLAIVVWKVGEEVSCISLIKADDFAGMVKSLLGPMMKEVIGKRNS